MQKRNPLAVVGLSIITFGIYDLYWLAKTRKSLNETTTTKVPSVWLLTIPIIVVVFAYILVVIGLISASSTVSNVATYGSSTAGATVTKEAGITLIGSIILWIGLIALGIIGIIWFFKFSKAVNEYTQGKMSTAVCFLVLYLIHLIGVALIQDTFNDIIDAGGAGAVGLGQPVPIAPGVAPVQMAAPQPIAPAQPVYQQPAVPPQPQTMPPQPVYQPPMPQPGAPAPFVPPQPVAPVQPPVDPNSNNGQPTPPVQ